MRGTDERIRAFYNVCQHRGNRLVSAERGLARRRRVPVRVPRLALRRRRHPERGCTARRTSRRAARAAVRNLVEIPCDTWAGFVWINMDEGCVGLREFLDPVADQLDCYRMERMKRTHWVTLEGDFNWKCVQDNFNESYHLPFVHPQTLPVMNEHYTGCQFDLYPSRPRPHAHAGRWTRPALRGQRRTAPSRASPRSSPSGSSTPSRTATTSRASAPRCSSASASSAPARATTSPATPTSS